MRHFRAVSTILLSVSARRGIQATRSLSTLRKIESKTTTTSPVISNIAFRPIFPLHARFYSPEIVVNVPQFADSISEGELSKWEVSVGQAVKQDQLIAVVETDKVNIEINAPEAGVIGELFHKPGDTIRTGTKLYVIKTGESAGTATAAPKAEAPKVEAKKTEAPKVETKKPEAPKVETPKVETPKVETKKPEVPKVEKTESKTSQPELFVSSERRVKITRMRAKIAERLKQSQDTAASLTTFNEIDIKPLTELREQYKDAFLKKHGVKLGFMSAFIKAASIALQDIPEVNAYIDGQDIVYHDYTDISVAVATPKGLVTPVIRGVEKMSYADIEKTLSELGSKAKDNKISIEDMAGGTFTISNGGVFGSLMGTPIINLPQSAILGMHGIKDRPVALHGQVVIRPMMYVALTYDHRLIDGREAVTFLVRVKELVEDPRRLILGL